MIYLLVAVVVVAARHGGLYCALIALARGKQNIFDIIPNPSDDGNRHKLDSVSLILQRTQVPWTIL